MPKYHLTTYGCQMNKSDSERIAALLEKNNFKASSSDQADFAIFNLCSVRQSAIDRVWGRINQIKKQKNKPKVILTGCILAADKKKFAPQVDLVLSITDLPRWPDKINHIHSIKECPDLEYFSITPKNESPFTAYVPIMTGCNNFCSYCAVPYTRGREKSRPAKDIYNEVHALVKQGYKEIILLGQNVNSYKNNKTTFPELLKKIDAIPGNYWLNFTSSHPKDLSQELIESYKTLKHLTPYLHLALQSGSNKIIKAMNRRYTAAHYTELTRELRKINPHIAITTDIIVGFPGETQKDFNDTKKIMNDIKFDMAYLAKYSPRPGTKAASFKDNITLTVKKKREQTLNSILKKTALEKNKKLIGQAQNILIESQKDGYLFGKTNQNKHVKIKSNKNLVGQFAKIEVTSAAPWHISGKLIN